jgi:hypothetical protein
MVDKISIKPHIVGLGDYTSESVITIVNAFTAPCNHPVTIEHINIRMIKTVAGTHLSYSTFNEAIANANIELYIAAPNHEVQNHTTERTWYSLQTIADNMLAHARLKWYANDVCYVLPFNKLQNKEGEPVTPYELCYDKIPMIKHFRVFLCNCVTKKYTITYPRGNGTTNTASQNDDKRIFIDPPPH